MSISLKKLFEPTALTDSLATIYTLGEATNTIVENMVVRLSNTTGSPETVEANAVPFGDTAAAVNKIYNAAIPANDYVLVSVPVLKNGDFIQFKQTNTGSIVNIQHESGLPKTP